MAWHYTTVTVTLDDVTRALEWFDPD